MSFDPTLRVPFGYGTSTISLAGLRTWLLVHHHPEYVRRLLSWLTFKEGTIGVGSGWRADGTQPDLPGFAPEGKSFHQNQKYSDGFIGACAVDLVAPDGPDGNNSHDTVQWANVPAQGSAEAGLWGVHCNIGSEAWHMQPIEIDGWQSWRDAGSPAPRANYPIPEPSEATVLLYRVQTGDSYWRIAETVHADGKATTARVQAIQAANDNRALHPGDLINIPGRVGDA